MLLYNQKKEFIGVDNEDLSELGFHNIAELLEESHDFADLFVKKPGYIHNFKNFSWIDFILHSESAEDPKAVIHAKGKNFACNLHVAPFSFASNENGFAITLKSLRTLKGAEDEQASRDLEAAGGVKSSPAAAPSETEAELDISFDEAPLPVQETESFEEQAPEPELPNFEESYTQELSEPEPFDIPESHEADLGFQAETENEFGAPSSIDYNVPLTLDDDVMHDDIETMPEPEPEIEIEAVEEKPASAPMLGDYVSTSDNEHLSDLIRSGDYIYDPKIAADELGLPVDLIEEFIGDFIDQAHEFHDDIFASVKSGDYDNVQNLSHKLKGVAANLRVEDAFDTLSVVNSSKDPEEILPNLNYFYTIIAKLEGKEAPQDIAIDSQTTDAVPVNDEEETDYAIDIKQPEDGPLLVDSEVTPLSDEAYDDLLPSTESFDEPEPEAEMSSADENEDIYGDLLSVEEPANTEYDIPSETSEDEDIYGDLLSVEESATAEYDIPDEPSYSEDSDEDILGSYEEDSAQIEEPAETELKTLNFDAQSTANELGIPLDIVNEFIQDFKEQVRTHQDDFNEAISTDDIRKINKTATLLKGMSDNLRLNEISEVLKQLQQEDDINNTAEALASLQAYVDQI